MCAELSAFHPTLAGWFAQAFGEPTPVQLEAWASIDAGRHTLIAAPTGSGKTLAALLPCLDRLARDKAAADKGTAPREPGVRVLYVTPLKALNNDIQHHLTGFIDDIERFRAESPVDGQDDWPGIRTAVRTGDTPSSERAKMIRRPPDVLVTTPESLYLLLTGEKSRAMLRTVRTVIVDEIHGLAPDKRGAHLSLTLERLSALCPSPVQRIGVSATQKPLERVARFLGGWERAGDAAETAGAAASEAGRAEGPGGGSAAADVTAGSAIGQADRAAGAGGSHPLGFAERPVRIVESDMTKTIQVRVTMPDLSRPAKTRDAVWQPIVERLMQLMEGSRSALLFVNSRRLCERLVLRLNDAAGYEMARAHHGSLSRERRLEVERMLKAGELRCLVATSSLELGIDVGHVDVVIQIDSPKTAAAGIQRIGRAGHAVGGVSRGFILARSRSELPEAAVLCRDIASRSIEAISLPEAPIDVLSQQMTAIVAAGDLSVDSLYALVAGSECYRSLPRERLEAALKVLAGFYPFARPLIDWDRGAGLLRKRAGTAMAAITGAGTIPQSSAYPVHHADSRSHLGELDEEYIAESRVGDVFQLGTSSWMITGIENDRVYVKEAPNRFSEIPFWRAEPGGRSYELGTRLGAFLRELADRFGLSPETAGRGGDGSGLAGLGRGADPAASSDGPAASSGHSAESGGPDSRLPGADAERFKTPDLAAVNPSGEELRVRGREEAAEDWLDAEYGLDRLAASELIGLASAQHRALGLPTDRRIMIEHYRDLMNQTRIIIHSVFGRRINRTWLLAIERQFERLLPYKPYGNAKDNGIELVLPDGDASWLQTLWQVTPESAEPLLSEAASGSPLLAIAFRRIAETSLLLSRSFTRTPMWQKRLRSEELLKQSLPYAEHFPYLQEAMRECLHSYLDAGGLKRLLERISGGEIEIAVRETNAPSPFAVQFLADYANTQLYEGDGLSEATQLQLLGVSKSLARELFGSETVAGAIDPAAMAAEASRLDTGGGRTPASPDELAALLKRRGDMSGGEIAAIAGAEALSWAESLRSAGRLALLRFGAEPRWICADEAEMYARFPAAESAIAFVAGRYAEGRLSFTEDELRGRYPDLSQQDAERVVDVLLAQDRIEQAPFAAHEGERIWSSRSVARRLIRLSMEQARKLAEPVDPVRWCAQMSMLQHALSGTQLAGIDGLREVIAKLQGFFLPASHWESIVFPARLSGYRKEELDLLCASGEVLWIGRKEEGEKEGKIAFFLTDAKPLYTPYLKQAAGKETKHPELLALLREGGASFLTRLGRDTGRTPSELLPELFDLVWEGHVSNDQFAPLRLQLLTKGRRLAKTGSGLGRWYWTGTLAEPDAPAGPTRGSAQIYGAARDGAAPYGSSSARAAAAETPPRGDGEAAEIGSAAGKAAEGPAAYATNRRRDAAPEELAESALHWTQHLLDSCGIVSKELVAAASPFAWDELLPVLRQLEHWGVVTRGMLIRGVQTLQFARRELLERVRQPLPGQDADAVTVLSAADPSNPFGLAADWPDAPGASFARKSGSYLILHRGRWRYWIENNGRKIVEIPEMPEPLQVKDSDASSDPDPAESAGRQPLEPELLKTVFRAVMRRQGLSKIKIERWNGLEAAESEAAPALRALGAERDSRALVLWTSTLQ
ncbi:DEAD/DEAH box helicase [Paenibacillus humicola]|uniref:DEAD/DEAH box helicase n=1 Tax=Paenibacillus humicola TaxID=3110540 RepID=UPI00237BA321|nr:DEAD/DEAH box helicase [Paenibacillus humicola]